MQFLYPISRQFPFDSVCEQIVRELEQRNWNVPGIDVEFHDYGSGEQKFRAVSWVRSKDFKLWFCRVQRTLPGGRLNDTAAITEIVIPKKELHVHEDESGPTFYLYVGGDYERDRERFMKCSKVNSKLRGEPKMYLQYGGSFNQKNRTYMGSRPPFLVHTNDLNREYDPEGKEPKFFCTDDVMAEFKKYLEEVVLSMIISTPIPLDKVDIFSAPEPIPVPASIGALFCFGDYNDADRISQGKENIGKLEPSERYGLSGGGCRLVSFGISNDGTVPDIAYDGFLWCGIGKVTEETAIESLDIPGHYRWSDREQFVFQIILNRADGVYIADHAQYEKRRKELAAAMEKDREDFTDAEVADFTLARARTIIPISEYQGGYEQPVVLVNREISFGEVEIVSGPHKRRGR